MPERMLWISSEARHEYVAHLNEGEEVWLEPDGSNLIVKVMPPGTPIPEIAQVEFLNRRVDLLHRSIQNLLEPESVLGIVVMKELEVKGWCVYERRLNGSYRRLGVPMPKRQARRVADEMGRTRWRSSQRPPS